MLICCCQSQQYTLILFRPTDATQKQNEIKNWAQGQRSARFSGVGLSHASTTSSRLPMRAMLLLTLQSNCQLARTSMSITAAVVNAAADARHTEGAPLVQANDFSEKNESVGWEDCRHGVL
jgi:hypothetical protein